MNSFDGSVIGDRAGKYMVVEQVSISSPHEVAQLLAAIESKANIVWPKGAALALAVMHMEAAEKAGEAKYIAKTSQSVSELRERFVMAQLRACPEVDAKTIITEAEILAQYILNGAERE